jgi:hypothetical protein
MTQTEAIKLIAEYDGWDDIGSGCYRKSGYTMHHVNFDYQTNIASLYFVAGRVAKELEQPKNVISGLARTEIKRTVLTFSPDLNPLLMAVADGINLLNTYK